MEITTGDRENRRSNERAPQPSDVLHEVVVTTVVFAFDGQSLRVLGIPVSQRNPRLRLPHTLVHSGTSLDEAADTAARLGTIFSALEMHQLEAISHDSWLNRDAAGEIEVSYFCLARAQGERGTLATRAGARWVGVDEERVFESESAERVAKACAELKRRARFEGMMFSLLAEEFTLSELQKLFEAIVGRTIDVRNFRKKIESLAILVESATKPRGMAYRPPRFFRFSPEAFAARLATDGEVRFY